MSRAEYRAHREKRGLTQAALAALLGIPREAVSRRESGKQRISREAAIALRSLPRKRGRLFDRPENKRLTT